VKVVGGLKLVFGIGNPGFRYRKTRHNVGFMVVDELARRCGVRVKKRFCESVIGEGEADGGVGVVIAKPLTYVNRCGGEYAGLLREYDLMLEEGLVVCDDIALPLGRIRVRRGGSSGGHNGLESIIEEVGTREFPRLRVGIGEVVGDGVDFVLSRFNKGERGAIAGAIGRAAEAAVVWARYGIDEAMNCYNRSGQDTERESRRNAID